jgi:hypothetical protein
VNSLLQYKSEPDLMVESDLVWCAGGTGTGSGELPAAKHQDRARPCGRLLGGGPHTNPQVLVQFRSADDLSAYNQVQIRILNRIRRSIQEGIHVALKI